MKVTLFPLVAVLATSIFSSSHVDAQVRVRGGVRVVAPRARVSVVVGRPYYRPYYYRPYSYRPLYDPFYFDSFYRPYYRPFYWYPYSQAGYGYGRYDGDGSLRVQVTPRDTEVFIDNYFAGTADDFDGMFQRLHVESGAHDITLYHDGFRTVRQRVYIQPTGTFRLRYNMMPLGPGEPQEPRPAEPPPVGPTGPGQPGQPGPFPQGRGGPPPQAGPGRYPPPPPGGYPGQQDGYPPPQGAYPPPAAQTGSSSLSIRVQPADAEVLIDGERWDTSAGDERLVVQVGPGQHHIEVRREGFRTYQSDVNVRPGEASTVNVSLNRQP